MAVLETRGPRRFGRWSVTQVVEWEGEALPLATMFPDVSQGAMLAASPAGPLARLTEGGMVITANQLFVVQGEEGISVIELGTGNGKSRPNEPYWDHQSLPYEETLASLGVALGDVRYAFISHGHLDHVGFATTPDGDGWVPSFPNARYVLHPQEWSYWNSLSEQDSRWRPSVEDCLRPLVDAAVVHWAVDGEVLGGVRVHDAAGHTPGSLVFELDRAPVWFVGDLLHHPSQIVHPEWAPAGFDEDLGRAVDQRRRYLTLLADRGATTYSMHMGDPFRVERDGDGFRYAVAG